MEKNITTLPAEWHRQAFIQLTWPHEDTDWKYILNEVERCYVNIAKEIASRQKLIIVCRNISRVKSMINSAYHNNISFYSIDSNDTWARDHGGITVFENGKSVIKDFCFNGWGKKFNAEKDNLITSKLFALSAFEEFEYSDVNNFVLEGGSIESDGEGTILTTEECLLSKNRNDNLSKSDIEDFLKSVFGSNRILWLKHGYLEGDDTDSHIDTLARFCSVNTIAYVKCTDINDEHFEELKRMKEELQSFRQSDGSTYKLVSLPMATPVFDQDDGHRLPATYANFLILNDAVLFPVYDCETDKEALVSIKEAFPEKEIVPVDCSVLIRQHGSLHCITMQYPEI
jgi:agmatine/peptidylarginine deiminase